MAAGLVKRKCPADDGLVTGTGEGVMVICLVLTPALDPTALPRVPTGSVPRPDYETVYLDIVLLITRSSAIAVIADRTACSILTLFVVSTTSRPVNKKSVCCQSANPINNYCGSASANSQSTHLSARAVAQASAVAPNGPERHCADSQR